MNDFDKNFMKNPKFITDIISTLENNKDYYKENEKNKLFVKVSENFNQLLQNSRKNYSISFSLRILKLMNLLERNNEISSLKYLEKLINFYEKKNFSEIAQILLFMQEILKNNDNIIQDYKTILMKLAKDTGELLNKMSTNILFLLQILYCFVRFEYDDKEFFVSILKSIKSQENLNTLLEIQFTSFTIALCKLDKKYPGIFNNKKEFFQILEEKILHRINEDSLSYARIPPIMYCYMVMSRRPNKTKSDLLKKIKESIDSFNKEETFILIIALSKLGLDNSFEISYVLWQKILIFSSISSKKGSTSNFSDKDLINLLLSLREINHTRLNEKVRSFFQEKKKELCTAFHKRLVSKVNPMSLKAKLVFLYECFVKQEMAADPSQKLVYSKFLMETELAALNNYDYLTVGTLALKFLDEKQIGEFEKKFREEYSQKRKFSDSLERKRLNIILDSFNRKTQNKPFLKMANN